MEAEALAALPPVARLMVRLCEIPSPSREEGLVAEVVRASLTALGAEVSEDDAAERIPAGCGNILARWPATVEGGVPIVFAAHLDTVPQTAPIEVTAVDGMLRNRNPAILGSDNKAAVAALLVALQHVVEEGRPHAGIELLFTPCEEIGLKGGAAFDVTRLTSRVGFVYDHTGDIGEIVFAAPSLRRLEAIFVGLAAHAGIIPEAGRSAIAAAANAIARMPLGRIDADTTANVGVIAGGTAANVVPELCTVVAEARSRDERALAGQLMAMLDALAWAASEGEVDLQTRVHDEFHGYRLSEGDLQVALASQALRACGRTPRLVPSGGGSDVNALLRNGFPCVNLCNGSMDVHTPNERISVASLVGMVEVTLAIVDAARDHTGG
jgi:tripeptide aminopeptidase